MSKSPESGFTLLEMVLVVLLLGVISSMSMSFIDNQDSQRRYEESLRKLDDIADAVLRESRYRDQLMYSGFVADNGRLPPVADPLLQPLIGKDGSWDEDASSNSWAERSSMTPAYRFAATGAFTSLSGITDTILKNRAENSLQKGYRSRYLTRGLDSNGEYRDSWGMNFLVSSDGNDYCYKYSGYLDTDALDTDACNAYPDTGRSSKPAGYNSDIPRQLDESRWSIAPSELNISLVNRSAAEASDSYRAVILVFRNDADGDTDHLWQTFYFEQTGIAAGSGVNTLTSLPDWHLEEDTGSPTTERIPAGQHLVVLFDDSADVSGSWSVNDVTDMALVNVFPGMTPQPEVVLVAKE